MDLAALAYELQLSERAGDITQGSIAIERPGATGYRHRCGPPGHEVYGQVTTRCDDEEEVDGGANPHQGPLVFLSIDQYNDRGQFYELIETGCSIDYVPFDNP